MSEAMAVQVEALRLSEGQSGFCFFMEQGLGKTYTTLADFARLVDAGEVTRLVVLCPNSFKAGWVKDMEKHGFPFIPHIYESGNAYGNDKFLKRQFNAAPVLIVNFEAIRSEKTQQYILDFIKGRNAMIAADESILISTHDSDQTKAAISLAKNFEYRRVLSGKYIKKGPHDLWSQWRFIGKLNGYPYYAFKGRFCEKGGFRGRTVTGVRNEEELQKMMQEFAFVARKIDWMDSCPEKLYTIRNYEMSKELKGMFMEMFHEFVLQLNDEEFVSVEQAITKYMKMAQIQCGFIIDNEGVPRELVPINKNPRINALRNFIDMELSGKIIIPYHHKFSLSLLERGFGDMNPAKITGGMTPDEVEANKHKFNADSSCRAIFLQTRASKYGHTLLGDQSSPEHACSTMAFFENTYSLDDRGQIEDRNHRWGQVQEHCTYVDFSGTVIDTKMVEALQKRESMFLTIAGIKNAVNSIYHNLTAT